MRWHRHVGCRVNNAYRKRKSLTTDGGTLEDAGFMVLDKHAHRVRFRDWTSKKIIIIVEGLMKAEKEGDKKEYDRCMKEYKALCARA